MPPTPKPNITLHDAVVQACEAVGGKGQTKSGIVQFVQATFPDAPGRTRIETVTGEVARNGRVRYDAERKRYFDPEIEPEDVEESGGPLSAQIIELLEENWTIGRSDSGEPFIVAKGSHIAVRARSRRFEEVITAYAWRELGKPANRKTLDEVVGAVAGMALDTDPAPVYTRVAPMGRAASVIDLGDPEEQVVVVDAHGWRIVDTAPDKVLFWRTDITAAFPKPTNSGNPAHLWDVLRIGSDRQDLMLGILGASFVPQVPHLIVAFTGEQGTAKTETLRAVSLLIDPLTAPTRTLPNDAQDLAVQMNSSWALAFDNVSRITPDISDALCRSVTGEAWLARQFYTNRELSAMVYDRIVMMDGIDLGALRGDLLDRTVIFELERIPPEERRTLMTWRDDLTGVRDQFRDRQSELVGVILDATSAIYRGITQADADALPRMADAAVLLSAFDVATGSKATAQFETARNDNMRLAVESDVVAMRVKQFAMAMKKTDVGVSANPTGAGLKWSGSMAKLLANTTPAREDMPKRWPTTSHHFSGRLRRVAPGLRMLGIGVDIKRTNRGAVVDLTYNPEFGHELDLVDPF